MDEKAKEYLPGVSVITLTGDRPIAFDRCYFYIRRQSRIPEQWIVGDDGIKPTPLPEVSFLQYVRSSKTPNIEKWQKRFCTNLKHCLEQVKYDKIIIMEDDDWYHPTYIEETIRRLDEGYDLVGQPKAIYYNIGYRRWRQNNNDKRASLCETAFRAKLLPKVIKLTMYNSGFVDSKLWKMARDRKWKWKLFEDKRLCVGMKGIPGRKGPGIGHRASGVRHKDEHWKYLQKLIGREDTVFYKLLMGQ